jgi:hypothetical protein
MEKKMSDNDNYHILIGVSESTVSRLISNLEKTIKILKNGGHVNLAHRLRIDKGNLEYWREKDESSCKSAQFFVNIITGLDSTGPTLPDGALSVSAASNIVYMLAYCGIIPNALCVCECEEAHVYDSENDEPPCKSAQDAV